MARRGQRTCLRVAGPVHGRAVTSHGTAVPRLAGAASICIMVFATAAGAQSRTDTGPGLPSADCGLKGDVSGKVTSVVDGETVVLSTGETVRLIGFKAPAAPLSPTGVRIWPPAALAKAALAALVLNHKVTARFGGTRTDRRGRLLAQLFVTDLAERVWVQRYLLERGLGRAYSFRDNYACIAELLRREALARTARRGIWGGSRYRILRADAPRTLGRLINSFQLVEGRVRKVTVLSRRTYLNFGDDWRRDFTVSIARKDRALFEADGIDPAKLEGRRVRVRGWLRWINGPAIEMTHPGQLEVLE